MSIKRPLAIITAAILIKLFLFALLLLHAPQSRFQNDSADYLDAAQVLSIQGTFARSNADGTLKYDLHRGPGYAFFIFILRGILQLPLNAVIIAQIILTLLAAGITYRAACLIDKNIAFLSAVIILFDPPVSIFSLIILSETLFFFLLACFMLTFVRFLKEKRTMQLFPAALLLVLATFVRPISYYLGVFLAGYILYANIRWANFRQGIAQGLVFLIVIYGLFGVWTARNYRLTGQKTFASVIQSNPEGFGLGAFIRQLKEQPNKAGLTFNYFKTSWRYFLSLMTRPGPFKYFRSVYFSAIGKVLAYPWMIFWLLGLVIGIWKINGNIYTCAAKNLRSFRARLSARFSAKPRAGKVGMDPGRSVCRYMEPRPEGRGEVLHYGFILLVILYFIAASVGGAGFHAGERFRVPMMPFIAVLSAYGWRVAYAGKRA